MVKGSVLNKEMRRKVQGSSSQSKIQECGTIVTKQDIHKHYFLLKKENKDKNGKSKEKDDDRVTTTTSDDLVTTTTSDDFIIDSGATLHVTPRKELFTSYTSSDFGELKIGNDGVNKVIGVGDVCLQTNT
ncbi:hypothetical protein CR513_15879, partial [Mucuna pruriens]